MLSISAMTSGQEVYYLSLAREDYYLAGGEPPGYWTGRGALGLGLRGAVEWQGLRAALEGFGPDGKRLTQEQRYTDGRSRQPGWDLTFSAPKSVSVLWATADPASQAKLQAAHDAAVRAAMGYLEVNAAVSRRGKGGVETERVGLLVSAFEHGTSRALDPQLHTHCLVINAGLREDGTWGALRSHDLYVHKMAAGAVYRSELAHHLRHELGLKLVRHKGNIGFEIAGVPQEILDAFSKRRQEIEAALEKVGWSDAWISEKLAKSTRTVKHHVAREKLFDVWSESASGLGFGPEQAQAILHANRITWARRPSLKQVTEEAINDAVTANGYFRERQIITDVANATQVDGAGIEKVVAAVREFITGTEGVTEFKIADGSTIYTTKDVLEQEENLLKRAEETKDSDRHLVRASTVERAIRARDTIKDEQKAALEYLTTGKGTIQCVSGMAGTGKTYLLNAARECWEHDGYKVLGCALAARAALQLESESGIKSCSVESLLYRADPSAKDLLKHHAKQFGRALKGRKTYAWKKPEINEKTVLVIDEAAMLGTKSLERLITLVADAGGKVVLVGDERQLQAIEAGGAFAALRKRLGGVELRSITRQREEWMRDAVRQFAEGDARGALTQYALAERLHVEADRTAAKSRLIKDWSEKRTADLSQTIILASTKDDVHGLNREAQAVRLKAGELKRSSAVKYCGELFYEGDRVMFTKNNSILGVVNGDMGVIERTSKGPAFGKPTVHIRLDRKQKGLFGIERAVRVSIELGGKDIITHAYAMTVHKAQGATLDKAFVLAGGWLQDRELAYVQMSRSRDETHIYASRADAGEDLESLIDSMRRSRAKKLVQDLVPAPAKQEPKVPEPQKAETPPQQVNPIQQA